MKVSCNLLVSLRAYRSSMSYCCHLGLIGQVYVLLVSLRAYRSGMTYCCHLRLIGQVCLIGVT